MIAPASRLAGSLTSGLLEMSRQRLRTGVLEGSTMPCSHCQGTGIIRSTESVALAVLRAIEDNLMSGSPRSLVAHCSRDAAMYLLNQKREFVQEIETRYGISIYIESSDSQQGADFSVERVNGGSAQPRRVDRQAVNVDSGFDEDAQNGEARDGEREDSEERRPRRRRRRRGRRGDGEVGSEAEAREAAPAADDDVAAASADADAEPNADGEERDGEERDGEERGNRRRRRGRRGGRRNRAERGGSENVAEPGAPQPEINVAEQPDWQADERGDNEDAVDAVDAVDGGAHAGEPGEAEPDRDAASLVAAAAPEPTAVGDAQDAAAEPDDHHEPVAVHHDDADDALDAEDDTVAARNLGEPATDAPIPDAESPVSAEIDEPAHAEIGTSDKAESPQHGNGRSGEPQSSEPVLERIVLSPPDSEGDAAVEEEAAAEPVRKGWWQRRFGA